MKVCWNVSVSPRSPRKIRDELSLLARYDGVIWSRASQAAFVKDLERSGLYEGQEGRKRDTFFARDRVAPMKTYGFVYEDKKTKVLRITAAGRALINRGSLAEEQRIFARQLIKWQFPSPQHCGKSYEIGASLFSSADGFKVHPFYCALYLVSHLDGLSKFDIAMALLTCTRDADVKKAERFVTSMRSNRRASSRKRVFERRSLEKRYAGTSVSANSALDYADALARLLAHSGLFSFVRDRIKINEARDVDVRSMLKAGPPKVRDYDNRSRFYAWFGDSNLPRMPWDDQAEKIRQVEALVATISTEIAAATFAVPSGAKSAIPEASTIGELDGRSLSHFLDTLPTILADVRRAALIGRLQDPSAKRAVMVYFDEINGKNVLDPALQLEWNLWRAILALDHTDQVIGRFAVDPALNPVSHAPGNGADAIARFEDFDLLLEATLLTGRKQYAAEGEPVTFHLAAHLRALREAANPRAGFTLFVAPKIHEEAANWFLLHSSGRVRDHRGQFLLPVVPITIKQLQVVLDVAATRGGLSQAEVRSFCELVIAAAVGTEDPNDWLARINDIVFSSSFCETPRELSAQTNAEAEQRSIQALFGIA